LITYFDFLAEEERLGSDFGAGADSVFAAAAGGAAVAVEPAAVFASGFVSVLAAALPESVAGALLAASFFAASL